MYPGCTGEGAVNLALKDWERLLRTGLAEPLRV